ncbi:unnamed protein product [Caenorhabditis angaria]|uniref:Major facilitator superfamily (MFS) profile domain-containing protein n=1 Tax=Caenorhabditis angaria TaxID=860376 RepID=A0A9P1ISQ1_9PELO|nr:unnamed protein product [Caenorhabditis angaria]
MADGYTTTAVHPVRRRYDSEHTVPQSDISMSVVTDDTRFENIRRRSTIYGLRDRSSGCCAINVEPILFLITCCFGLMSTNSSLFTYWARCVEIASENQEKYSHNVTYTCALIAKSNNTLQDEVERDIASMKIWLQICGCLPTLITSPIVGNWSDRNGRKAPLLFSLLGFFLSNLIQLLATLTYESINIYYWSFSGELLMALFGGGAATFSTALAIVTDDCRHKLKPGSSTVPFRVGLASFIQSLGMLTGTFIVSQMSVPALTSVERHAESYFKVAFIQVGFSLIALIYAIFFVRETHFPKREDFQYNQFDQLDNIEEELDETSGQISTHKKSIIGKFQNYFGQIFGVLLARRPGWTRLCLCVSVFFVFIEFLSFDPALLLLLVKRMPFAWNDKLFSYFSLLRTILTSVGMVLCPLLLTLFHWLGKDSLLIILALAASAGASFLTAFATTTNQIFYTCMFAVLMGGMQPAYRSFLPRMVAKEETARLLTAVTIIMSFSPILSSIIFNSIFNATLDWWAGFSFFVAAIFQTVVFFGQIVIHLLMRPQWKLEKQLRAHRGLENEDREIDYHPGDAEQRSISNTAVDSDSGSRRENI